MSLSEQLQKLVSDQLVVGIAYLTPKGKLRGTPIWITTNGTEIFFYSREQRKKIQYLKKSHHCIVIFNNGTVEGSVEIVFKDDERFNKNYEFLDPRYSHDPNYKTYKEIWDVMVLITPKKIY